MSRTWLRHLSEVRSQVTGHGEEGGQAARMPGATFKFRACGHFILPRPGGVRPLWLLALRASVFHPPKAASPPSQVSGQQQLRPELWGHWRPGRKVMGVKHPLTARGPAQVHWGPGATHSPLPAPLFLMGVVTGGEVMGSMVRAAW